MNHHLTEKIIIIKRKIWQYSAADFDRANDRLGRRNINSDDVNSSVLAWQSLFLQIMDIVELFYSILASGIHRKRYVVAWMLALT